MTNNKAHKLEYVEYIIAQIILVLIVLFVFSDAVMRYAGFPLVWASDIAKLLFTWLVFLGGDIALRHNRHIGIDLIVNMLPNRLKRIVLIFIQLLIAAFLIAIAWYGLSLTFQNVERTFDSLRVSYAYATASAPIGCILMLQTTIKKIIELMKSPLSETFHDINKDADCTMDVNALSENH